MTDSSLKDRIFFFAALLFSWSTAPASEIVTGYRVVFGQKPGIYQVAVDVGPVSEATLEVDTRRYKYAAVVAYNGAGSSTPSRPVALFSPKRPNGPKVCEL